MAERRGRRGDRDRSRPDHWAVELYEREDGIQPAEVFVQEISEDIAHRLFGYVDHVAEDLLRFPAGPEWQAMHGEALGCHEVRVRFGTRLYRMYVRLDAGPFQGQPGLGRLVLLSDESKPTGTALPPNVYRAVGEMARDYLQTRKVSPAAE